MHLNIDSDRDGVPDYKDCRPFDRYKQHVSETTKKRLKDLPIYLSTSGEDKAYRIFDKTKSQLQRNQEEPETLEHYPKRAEEEFLSIVKKYPSVLGEMEKAQPVDVIYTSLEEGEPTGFKTSLGQAQAEIELVRRENKETLSPDKKKRAVAYAMLKTLKREEQYKDMLGHRRHYLTDEENELYKSSLKKYYAKEFAKREIRKVEGEAKELPIEGYTKILKLELATENYMQPKFFPTIIPKEFMFDVVASDEFIRWLREEVGIKEKREGMKDKEIVYWFRRDNFIYVMIVFTPYKYKEGYGAQKITFLSIFPEETEVGRFKANIWFWKEPLGWKWLRERNIGLD